MPAQCLWPWGGGQPDPWPLFLVCCCCRFPLAEEPHSWDFLSYWALRQGPHMALTLFSPIPLSPGWQHHEISTAVPKCHVTEDTGHPALRDTDKHLNALICPCSNFTHQLLGQKYSFTLWKNSLLKTFYKTWHHMALSLIVQLFLLPPLERDELKSEFVLEACPSLHAAALWKAPLLKLKQ